MAEESGDNVRDSRVDAPDLQSILSSSRSRRHSHSRRNKKNKYGKNEKNTFKGPLVGYEKYVYDILMNKCSDTFNTTTRKLYEYISRTVSNAGEFMNAMNPDDLGFENINEPDDPDNAATQVEYEKWKNKVQELE